MIVVTPNGRHDIPDEVANRSGLLKQYLSEGRAQEVSLNGRFLSPEVVERVLAYLQSNAIPRGQETDSLVFKMILAADYLQIPELLSMYTAKIRNVLTHSQTADSVRAAFNLKHDLSTAEEAAVRNEAPWGQELDLVETYNSNSMRDMTVSMMVDGESRFRTITADPLYGGRDEVAYDIVKYVQPRKPTAPIPDDHAPSCSSCKTQFTTVTRRHHCRCCGRVYCYSCSSRYIQLPEKMNVYQGYSSVYTKAKSWVTWSVEIPSEAQRVCESCYDAVTEQEELWTYIQAFQVIALELPLLKRAATVCKNWRRAVILCLSALRELQYLLPTGHLSVNEKKMLWNNRNIWAGHSQWIIALLKAVDWNDPDAARQAIDILKTPERCYSCWRTMCSRSCQQSLSPADSLWLLSEDMHNLELREYAVERLKQSSPVELLCYLPVLVHDIRYGDAGPLVDFLLHQALSDYHFCNDLYWSLVTCAESKKYKRLYDSVLQRLLVAITSTHGEARARQLIIGQDLVSYLEAIPAPPNTQQIHGLFANLDRMCRTPIALPINSTIEARSFKPEGVKIKKSKTAPIVIPCVTRSTRPAIYNVTGNSSLSEGEEYEYTFMFKREDVRKDQIVLNVIKLMDTIIKKELNYDLKVLTYRVIPTGSSDGLIEMMPHSKTLFEILRTSSKIYTHLVNHNGGSQVHSLLTTYMRSLAAWTVITYLLGVGDRHMDNIMLTDSGILFHIDYGFVLGKDPKPLAPHIRMNESMIEGMGGKDSSHYKDFKDICADVFLCLRRHISLFFNLLLVMAKADPPVTDLIFDAKYLEEQLSKRFLPGQTEAEARSTIHHLVNKTDGYVQSVTDFLHQHSRDNTISESVKSFTNVSSYAYNGALNYFNWSTRK